MKEEIHGSADESDQAEVSRSEVKRQAERLQELGRQIYQLPKSQREALPLSDELRAAFTEADRISHSNALRRHFQYVGKLMRQIDQQPLLDALELNGRGGRPKSPDPLLSLVAQLLEEGSQGIEQLLVEYPLMERQRLNQLVRNLRKAIQSADTSAPGDTTPRSAGQLEKQRLAEKKLIAYLREFFS